MLEIRTCFLGRRSSGPPGTHVPGQYDGVFCGSRFVAGETAEEAELGKARPQRHRGPHCPLELLAVSPLPLPPCASSPGAWHAACVRVCVMHMWVWGACEGHEAETVLLTGNPTTSCTLILSS